MDTESDYKLFFEFIETYLPKGFSNINRDDLLMQKIRAMMKANRQYFYVGDLLKFEINYTCSTVKDLLGIEPEDFDPGKQFKITHIDDLQRHSIARSNMIKIANEIFCSKNDYSILSTNLRFLNANNEYSNFIVQAYTFYSNTPIPSVYGLFIATDISWFGPIKHGYNFYFGKDMSYFRVPDKKIITTGCFFTNREFEILDLIRQGFDSKTIGEKLFLSTHTVDTHRRNIIKKSGHNSTSELIFSLHERGFF